jgi:hypothetical protein
MPTASAVRRKTLPDDTNPGPGLLVAIGALLGAGFVARR